MTNTTTISLVAQAKPEDDWLHRFRNFGEDVFVRFRPEYDVSLHEIDAAFNGFDIRAVPQERSGAVVKGLVEVVREHHLEDSVFVTGEQVTTARTVGLVLDGSFGERLFPLAVRRDLWVVPSDANRPAVEQIRTWSWLNDYPERTSVTMWSSPIATATESDWLALLETIERHHGGFMRPARANAERLRGAGDGCDCIRAGAVRLRPDDSDGAGVPGVEARALVRVFLLAVAVLAALARWKSVRRVQQAGYSAEVVARVNRLMDVQFAILRGGPGWTELDDEVRSICRSR
ncbi:MAG TPA: hypothetical protein VEU30_01985 [Thermoanaerobaculia bacterium]|nr:hypothetical protein [Thermoanaerobaculia bacterium]